VFFFFFFNEKRGFIDLSLLTKMCNDSNKGLF